MSCHSLLRIVLLFGGLLLTRGFVVVIRFQQKQQYLPSPAAFVSKRNSNVHVSLNAMARDNVEDPLIMEEKGMIQSPSDSEEVEDIESFLDEAHSDMEGQQKKATVNYHSDYGLNDVDDVDDVMEMTKTEIPADDIENDFLDWTTMTTTNTETTATTTSGIDLGDDDIVDDSSKITESSSFVESIIKPHVLQKDLIEEEDEDLDYIVHTYRDFATGKELGWTDDDVTPHSVAAAAAVGGGLLSSTTNTPRPHPNPKDDHITMGMMGSGKFDAFGIEEVDEEYEEPDTDMETADELCSGNF